MIDGMVDAVLIGTASRGLGSRLALELRASPIQVESKTFPDGESYIRIPEEVRGIDVAVVQSTYYPQNRHLVELFLILDALTDLGVDSITAIVPYLAYARQDKRFRPGEAISSHTVIKILERLGARRFLTCNIHKEEILTHFTIPALNISATPAVADYIKGRGLQDPLILAPDAGGAALAEDVARRVGSDHAVFEKHRDKETGAVETEFKKIPVEGRDVVIVDDIISTGSTIANVARMVKSQKARKVLTVCIHPVLASGAEERMREAGVDQVVGTDCVESPVSHITVAPLLAEALRKSL
ncbi:MAG: ribose-phosphate diphosphokinase [Candidatus Bathyarchaeia archaeon]